MHHLRLTENMHVRLAHNDRIAADKFAAWLLRVGDGSKPTVVGSYDDLIRIPQEMTVNNVDDLVNSVFPDLANEQMFASRAILASRNDDADEINALVVQRLAGTAHEYRSIDSVSREDGILYPTEFLNSLNLSGMPPH